MNIEDQIAIMEMMRKFDFNCISDYEEFFGDLEDKYTVEKITE